MSIDIIRETLREADRPLTYKEIVDITGINQNMVSTYMQRLRKGRELDVSFQYHRTKNRNGENHGIRYNLFALKE